LANESSNTTRIGKILVEKDALVSITGDKEGSALDDNMRSRIVENTQELYKTAKDLNITVNDPEYQKMLS